jgi:UDP-glucose 4-epimerase
MTNHFDRVLITGGAGLIGSHIADLMIREGASEIVIFDDLSRGRIENLAWARAHGRVTLVEGDIRDRGALAAAMRGIDLVFHQAAIRITQCASEPRLALEVLADGTFNVIEAAQKVGVRRLVAASSASVLGAADSFPTTELHHPYNNRTLYGACKAFNEGLLRSYHEKHGLPYVALRYFNVYGPRMDAVGKYTEVMIRWMERIEAGQAPIVFGTGDQTMDFVFVEDIARANVLAAKAAVSDEVFNVATGVETSLLELAQAMLETMGSTLQLEYGPARVGTDVPRRLADVSKAETLLGFRARVSLREGLARLVDWWRSQQTVR